MSALYRGMKPDGASNSTFRPPPAARGSASGLFCGKKDCVFMKQIPSVEDIDSSPPDVVMGLCNGKTMEREGLEDSRHASPAAEEVNLVGSTDYGSMPVLPSTLGGTVSILVSPKTASGVGEDSMDVVEQNAQVVPDVGSGSVADSPMRLGGNCNSEGSRLGDSRHAPPDSDVLVPDERLIINREGCYLGLSEAGRDVQYLGSVIVEMGTIIRRLEWRVDALEDDLDKARRDALVAPIHLAIPLPRATVKGKQGDIGNTPKLNSPAITQSGVAGLPQRPATITMTTVVWPCDIPAPFPVAKPAVSWSQVASTGAEGGNFTLVSQRKIKSPPPEARLTERERHVVVRFVKRGSKAQVPAGVSSEMIKNALNGVLAMGSNGCFGSC